jgi:hypothetical protein
MSRSICQVFEDNPGFSDECVQEKYYTIGLILFTKTYETKHLKVHEKYYRPSKKYGTKHLKQ